MNEEESKALHEQKEDEIQEHYAKVELLVDKEIERMAREMMRAHPEIKEFVKGMGTYCFNGADGEPLYDYRTSLEDFKAFDDFITEWDDIFKITGMPLRFTVDGPRVTIW